MKRFRFPLRPVGVLRSHQASRARDVFATSVQAYVQSGRLLAEARASAAEFEAGLYRGREGVFNAIGEAHRLQGYRRAAAAELEAERALFAARDLMNQRRAEYLEAHRKLEVINRLETKARATYRVAVNREEQAEFDEFAARRATRPEPLFSP